MVCIQCGRNQGSQNEGEMRVTTKREGDNKTATETGPKEVSAPTCGTSPKGWFLFITSYLSGGVHRIRMHYDRKTMHMN